MEEENVEFKPNVWEKGNGSVHDFYMISFYSIIWAEWIKQLNF